MIGNDETPGSGILADSSHSLRRRARSLTLVGFVDHWLEEEPNPTPTRRRIAYSTRNAKIDSASLRKRTEKRTIARVNGLLLDPEPSR